VDKFSPSLFLTAQKSPSEEWTDNDSVLTGLDTHAAGCSQDKASAKHIYNYFH
jgi:hypothetical protein